MYILCTNLFTCHKFLNSKMALVNVFRKIFFDGACMVYNMQLQHDLFRVRSAESVDLFQFYQFI